LRLPLIWTEARRRGFSLSDLGRWLCSAPAKLVGLQDRKGALAAGYDADLIIWNPNQQFRVEGKKLHHRHKLTPYEGKLLEGVVERTLLRGRQIHMDGETGGRPLGTLIQMRDVTV
jgi:allantoinase